MDKEPRSRTGEDPICTDRNPGRTDRNPSRTDKEQGCTDKNPSRTDKEQDRTDKHPRRTTSINFAPTRAALFQCRGTSGSRHSVLLRGST